MGLASIEGVLLGELNVFTRRVGNVKKGSEVELAWGEEPVRFDLSVHDSIYKRV
jgi:hypothetical protein